LYGLNFDKDFKTFWVYIQELLEKLFQNFLLFLEVISYFEEMEFQNAIWYLLKHMQVTLQRNIYILNFIREAIPYQQGISKWISKYPKMFSLISKHYFKTLFSIYENIQRNPYGIIAFIFAKF
jgi:hypothetical protein